MNPEIHALTGAYALDALDEVERAAFERHLSECPACEQEVRELRETAARLGETNAVTPPQGLRTRVLERVSATRQRPPHVAGAPGRMARSRRWAVRGGAVVGAAAVVAAVVFGVQWSHTQDQLHHAEQHMAGIRAVLGASDATMSHGSGSHGGSAMAVASASKDKTVVMVSGLPDVPADRGYQLWLLGSYGARSAGMLRHGTDGQMAPVVAPIPEGTQQVGITVEPEGGSDHPTTNPVLLFPLT